MKLHKYTESELIKAVSISTSMRQTLLVLNVAPFGGNYDVLRKAIKHFNLDASHFKGQAWNKGIKLPVKKALSEYLTQGSNISSYKLKNRLLREQVIELKCSNCDNTTWLNQPIPLELDHINGNNKDNRLPSLRLLCPNCHALTPTYRSKNRKKA
ncbi:MAG: hypothetical protein GY815_18720 [Gammaproteobacteria bacterium]|nr:hypothetical protein [Gammaproteobacteria bacterium]